MNKLTLCVISGIKSDLSKLKFPDSEIIEFEKFNFDVDEQLICINKSIENEFILDFSKRFIVFYNKNNPLDYISKTINFLLLLFPSDLYLEFFIDYNIQGNLKKVTSYHKVDSHSRDKNPLTFKSEKLSIINRFIKHYYKDYRTLGYLDIAISNYLGAFQIYQLQSKFLSLCICLESIIAENSELLYRISRGCAIIIGSNSNESNIIFSNIKKIYAFRSKIIHVSPYQSEKLEEYIDYTECLVSKILIELLIHKIKDIKDLNKKFTELGFGDREKLSSKWFSFIYNQHIESEILRILK